MLGAQGCINNSSGNSYLLLLIDSDLFDSVVAVKFVSSSVGRLGEILTTMVNRMLIACSHRRHGQDKTVMSCQCRRCEQAIRDEDVLSCSTASVELVQRPSRQFHVVLEKIFNNSVCYMRSWSVKDQRPCSSESVTQSPAAALRWSRHGIKYTRTVCAPAHVRVLERENCTATKNNLLTSTSLSGDCLSHEPSLHACTIQLTVFSTFNAIATCLHRAGFNAAVVLTGDVPAV